MKTDVWQDHIVIDPNLHHGDPCIIGTRAPVSMILGSLADGMTPSEIQDAYPQLSIDNMLQLNYVKNYYSGLLVA